MNASMIDKMKPNSFTKMLDNRVKELNENRYNNYFADMLKGADWIFDGIENRWHGQTPYLITDLKDADGLATQTVFKKGLEQILEFVGVFAEIDSHRIGRFAKELKHNNELEHLPTICELENGRDIIIGDLGSLEPVMANGHVPNLLNVDHHGPKNGFDKHFVNINPNNHGIDGGRELSTAMQATMLVNIVYDMLEAEYGNSADVNTRKNLNKLRKNLDLISLIGLAGASADMQQKEGLNSVLFDYLEDSSRKVIKKYDSPFYGINSKEAKKVWAQSDPVFNFKYFVPDRDELSKVFNKEFHNLSTRENSNFENLYDKYRLAFTTENLKKNSDNNPRINIAYVNTLNNAELNELDNLVRELTGERLFEDNNNGDLIVSSRFAVSEFEDFTDNLIKNEEKISIATELLRNAKGDENKNSFDPEGSIAQQPGLSKYMVSKFQDSIIAFSEPSERDYYLAKLRRKQYVSTYDLDIVGTSVAELANSMTALSKLGHGDVFLKAIDEILDLRESSPRQLGRANIDMVLEHSFIYRLSVYNGMEALTDKLSNPKAISRLGNKDSRIVYCDMSFLKGVISENINLERVNGVFLGIAANSQIFPGGKVISFGGVPTEFDDEKYIKISGRVTDSNEYLGINLRSLMEKYGGGGHKQAAACVIPENRLEDFLYAAQRHNYFGE